VSSDPDRDHAERLRVLIESASDYAIISSDAAGRITSWNPAAENIFGYAAREALGQPAAIIFRPEDRAAGIPEAEMARARAVGRADDERWHATKTGALIYLRGVLAPLRDGDAVKGYVKIARDETTRRQLQDALRTAHEELEQRIRERTDELRASNAKLEEELRERRAAEERITALFRRLVTVQEDERRRIAREIHDQIGQQMTALRLNLETLESKCHGDRALELQAWWTRALAEELDHSIDFLTWDLRPAAFDHLGLTAAIDQLVRGWSERFGAFAEFQAVDMEGVSLPDHVEINLYRIVQESLHNIHKHADAGKVAVVLERRGDRVVLAVEDDGRGFEPHAASVREGSGMGLLSMRERAALIGGDLDIESSPGAGTTIYARVPIVQAD
jgi:PAS domain S-box-containing protein